MHPLRRLKMHPLGLRSRSTPVAWIVDIDGWLVDARTLSAEVQEAARQRGLIPDIDALRAA